ncbi:50S ribosomal protein L24 [Botrimarina colliarenosi]|uniref:Large ribosomal subunit protein uL24 n=1 Tax=Botrimarina colliarenosi TaxID=2528001 RepID=A0A5C6AAS2_9BACT|nr:50S ribosomal protein L24 [Botrimarina colliarenosi]TWT96659.1 50S ribosomal protein L24 [Botrimarina colliarenosi]
MLIKTGDTVEVIAGADKGARSKVIKVDRTAGKALVEGVNKVFKHVKRSQKHPQGGRLSKEMPIDISKVQYYCESCGKRARLGLRYTDEGAKERYCKKCSTSAGEIAPAKPAYAKK